MRSGLTILAATLLAAAAPAAAQDVPVDSLGLQKARAEALKTKGMKPAYTRRFDLSGLPDYKPTRRMS